MRRFERRLKTILEGSSLDACSTGVPISLRLYRGEHSGNYRTDPSRGVFYTPHAAGAYSYSQPGQNSLRKRGSNVRVAQLRLQNPLVVQSTEEVIRHLLDLGKFPEAAARKFIEVGAYANPVAERAIAKYARMAGYDSIVYQGGLDEVVKL